MIEYREGRRPFFARHDKCGSMIEYREVNSPFLEVRRGDMQRNLALFRIPNLGFQSGDSAFRVQMTAHIARAAQQSVIDFH